MSDRRLFVKSALMLSGALFGLEGQGFSMMGRGSSAEKAEALPGEYFRRLAKWCAVVQDGLRDQPGATLKELEARPGWNHFPYTILPAAVLYAKKHSANRWWS